MRRQPQQQQQQPDPALQFVPQSGPSGMTQADPTSPADRAVAAALARPGVSGFSVTANPGAPPAGSATANPGQPNLGSALPGIGNVFADAIGRAQRAIQIQPRLFDDGSSGSGGSAGGAPSYYSGE
jgi:hypothetical protein